MIKKYFKLICLPTATIAPIVLSTSCSSKLDSYVQQYSDKYFSTWFETLKFDPNWNWDTSKCENVTENNEAEVVKMYTYGDGWSVWNGFLHSKGSQTPTQEELDTVVESQTITIPDKTDYKNFNKRIAKTVNIKVGSYQILENALKRAKCGKGVIYSGSEFNQDDLYGQLNTLMGCEDLDWKTSNPKDYRAKANLKNLIGKEIVNYGFMSTSFKKNLAWSFLFNPFSDSFKNVVFYEIEIDENTQGAYTSDVTRLYNGTTLSWPHEYQMTMNRNLHLTINDAYWTNTINHCNVLYLKCKGVTIN